MQIEVNLVAVAQKQPWVRKGCLEKQGCWGWPHSTVTEGPAAALDLQHCWGCSQTMESLEGGGQTQTLVKKGCLVMQGCWDWPHSMGTMDQAAVEEMQHCWDCSQTRGNLEVEVQTQPWVMKGCLVTKDCYNKFSNEMRNRG